MIDADFNGDGTVPIRNEKHLCELCEVLVDKVRDKAEKDRGKGERS